MATNSATVGVMAALLAPAVAISRAIQRHRLAGTPEERARFGERLRVTLRIAPGVPRVQVPYLCIQQIVENAVRHGLGGKAGAGHVTITAEDTRHEYRITVADDGIGIKADVLREVLVLGPRRALDRRRIHPHSSPLPRAPRRRHRGAVGRRAPDGARRRRDHPRRTEAHARGQGASESSIGVRDPAPRGGTAHLRRRGTGTRTTMNER